jgi:hypothetical protein
VVSLDGNCGNWISVLLLIGCMTDKTFTVFK